MKRKHYRQKIRYVWTVSGVGEITILETYTDGGESRALKKIEKQYPNRRVKLNYIAYQ